MSICLTTDESILTVWDLLSTVFAWNFPVRIHVRLKLPTSFAWFVTLLTGYHTIIMLVLHVQLEMFFRESFKTAYDTRKHGDCRFVLLAMMRCMSNVIIFPYQNENILCRKWYVLNLVCFGSGTATFDERGTIESEIEERCSTRLCAHQPSSNTCQTSTDGSSLPVTLRLGKSSFNI